MGEAKSRVAACVVRQPLLPLCAASEPTQCFSGCVCFRAAGLLFDMERWSAARPTDIRQISGWTGSAERSLQQCTRTRSILETTWSLLTCKRCLTLPDTAPGRSRRRTIRSGGRTT